MTSASCAASTAAFAASIAPLGLATPAAEAVPSAGAAARGAGGVEGCARPPTPTSAMAGGAEVLPSNAWARGGNEEALSARRTIGCGEDGCRLASELASGLVAALVSTLV